MYACYIGCTRTCFASAWLVFAFEDDEELQLSMGMSKDMHLAIAYGSTQIRVGTAIFGERH